MRHLFDRILWASENLEPVQPRYVICFQQPGTEQMAVLNASPEWLAMAMHGGLLPPVSVYHELRCEWTHKDGRVVHTRLNEHPGKGWENGTVLNGALLHDTPPIGPLSEEQAMEYLLEKDVPLAVWADYDTANKPRFIFCKREQLPQTRLFRDAWRMLPPELLEKAA